MNKYSYVNPIHPQPQPQKPLYNYSPKYTQQPFKLSTVQTHSIPKLPKLPKKHNFSIYTNQHKLYQIQQTPLFNLKKLQKLRL